MQEFGSQATAYRRILNSAQDASAAGDLALIFNYMKLLDPGSVVRESEFATAQNAAGVPERLRSQYNRVLSGERLSDNQRGDFVDRSHRLYEGAQTDYNAVIDEYRQVGEARGYPEEEWLINRALTGDLALGDDQGSPGEASSPVLNQTVDLTPDQQAILEKYAK